MMLSLDTAYRSFGGEVEASSTPTICRLPDSRRHQLSAIARSSINDAKLVLVAHDLASSGRWRDRPCLDDPACAVRHSVSAFQGLRCDPGVPAGVLLVWSCHFRRELHLSVFQFARRLCANGHGVTAD